MADPKDPGTRATEERRQQQVAPPTPEDKQQKQKKKKRYSRNTRDVQEYQLGLTRALARVSRAVSEGMDDYRGRHEGSADGRRDGAMIDFAENVSLALGTTMREMSQAPNDLARRIPARRIWRRMRGMFFVNPFFR